MVQGLGETYVKVFLWLTLLGFLSASLLVITVRLLTRLRVQWCLLMVVLLGPITAYVFNRQFHHETFVRSHQSHNKLVPKEGCLRYEPSFGHPFAAYAMTRTQFDE